MGLFPDLGGRRTRPPLRAASTPQRRLSRACDDHAGRVAGLHTAEQGGLNDQTLTRRDLRANSLTIKLTHARSADIRPQPAQRVPR